MPLQTALKGKSEIDMRCYLMANFKYNCLLHMYATNLSSDEYVMVWQAIIRKLRYSSTADKLWSEYWSPKWNTEEEIRFHQTVGWADITLSERTIGYDIFRLHLALYQYQLSKFINWTILYSYFLLDTNIVWNPYDKKICNLYLCISEQFICCVISVWVIYVKSFKVEKSTFQC